MLVKEASIDFDHNVLLQLSEVDQDAVAGFCGKIISLDDVESIVNLKLKTIYLCGDMSLLQKVYSIITSAERILIVEDLSINVGECIDAGLSLIHSGRLPICIHGLGVLYRNYFDAEINCYDRICEEHEFQRLTESTKPGVAHRTGIYLSHVDKKGDDYLFSLLRCSTNLSGPTENFRSTDHYIVGAANIESESVFNNAANLNHVLAQVYHNAPADGLKKQTKAKIKAHADKTKDMPVNGVMAFCTFYSGLEKLTPLKSNPFDYGYKEVSGLTKLHFRRKKCIDIEVNTELPEEFTVTLYPNSIFLMPLSTNRYYTHEIRSSVLNAEMLPVRLGYVVRCSKTQAVYRSSENNVSLCGKSTPLKIPSEKEMAELKKLYADENKTMDFIEYSDEFNFSMNEGDYLCPGYRAEDEFRRYYLPLKENVFSELMESVRFEKLAKARYGAVLVDGSDHLRTPIVRTTTKYEYPAQIFKPIHNTISQLIQLHASLPLKFNNALIERYENGYSKMGFHSDQALDLNLGSCIALFSAYEFPERDTPLRKLVVESKSDGEERFEIPLAHNSVVIFTSETNRRFRHKIILDTSCHPEENPWVGITFRTSKTFIRHNNASAYFENGQQLVLADENQAQEFFMLRGKENKESDFEYPDIGFTLSKSDLMPPIE